MARFVYVGSETRIDGGHRLEGITVFHMDPASGQLDPIQAVESGENPSFMAFHPSKQYLYAVNELNPGKVTAFGVNASTGIIGKLNEAVLRGNGPCYISIDPSGKWGFVANYGGGTVSVVKIHPDGTVEQGLDNIKHQGRGDDPKRQEGPHAHSAIVSPKAQYVLAADLGTNKIYIYKLEERFGVLRTHESYGAAPGAGPRHMRFHPNGKFLYVCNELNNTVVAYRWLPKDGKLEQLGTLPTLPEDFTGYNLVADLQMTPDGRFLYVSNRGHDSLAVFRVEGEGGELAFVDRVSTEGKWPRNFSIDPDGRFLLVANQQSSCLVLYEIDPGTGVPRFTGQKTEVDRPMFATIVDL